MRGIARGLGTGWLAALLSAGCSAPAPSPPRYPTLPGKQPTQAVPNDDPARLGGRLYDDFARELKLDFAPDDPKTPAPDGRGGPLGNGTLPDAEGKPMLNTGHDYRLKQLLGTDLHGAAGILGQEFKATGTVLLPDLLKDTDSRELWRARLTKGEDAIPAYGSVLSAAQIEALLDFLLGVRDGALARPDALFTLDPQAPGFYRLAAGGDAARGAELYQRTCKKCHGAKGTSFSFGADKHSIGSFLRARADQAWLDVLVGVPGTAMGPQLSPSLPAAEQAQALLDLFAATCDRAQFPKGQAEDVPDGDARCGAYLK
ncbi:MAG TPA: cytochrome c [Polyangiales bacterium]